MNVPKKGPFWAPRWRPKWALSSLMFGLLWIILGYLGPSCGYLVAPVGLPWISLGYLGPSCGYLFSNYYLLLLTITTYCRLLLLLLQMGLTFACVRPSLDHLGLSWALRSLTFGLPWIILGHSWAILWLSGRFCRHSLDQLGLSWAILWLSLL